MRRGGSPGPRAGVCQGQVQDGLDGHQGPGLPANALQTLSLCPSPDLTHRSQTPQVCAATSDPGDTPTRPGGYTY